LLSANGLSKGEVIYDRKYSSFSQIKTGEIDWHKIFEDCGWFHWTAITPALNEELAEVMKEALEVAYSKGITISVDLNYRNKLWQYGKSPLEVMPELVKYCHIIMGNIWASRNMLGTSIDSNLNRNTSPEEYFEFAKKNPNLEIFVTFDADGQHQIKDIENIISPIKENKADIVFGTRFQDDKTKMPFLKRIILKLAVRYTNLSTGVPLTDAHNGFRAMNRTALNEMQLNLNGMAHASEIVAIAHKSNLRIAETPVEILYTKYSKAKGELSKSSSKTMIRPCF
jgi:RNase adaptor protein for sRNA GlmZ degradation